MRESVMLSLKQLAIVAFGALGPTEVRLSLEFFRFFFSFSLFFEFLLYFFFFSFPLIHLVSSFRSLRVPYLDASGKG